MTAIIITNNQLAIVTVTPQLNIGEVQLSADRRSTKEAKLTDEQRVRRVVLPVNYWGELSATTAGIRSQSLTDLLRSSLTRVGSDRLKDTLEENPLATTVSAADYTVTALLSWSEETATSRGSITFTRQQAEEWFSGIVWPAISTRYDGDTNKQQAIKSYLSNRYGALAAKNHGLATVAEATKLLSLIPETAADSDTGDNTITIEIVGRLTHIEKQLTAKANEATVSMADL